MELEVAYATASMPNLLPLPSPPPSPTPSYSSSSSSSPSPPPPSPEVMIFHVDDLPTPPSSMPSPITPIGSSGVAEPTSQQQSPTPTPPSPREPLFSSTPRWLPPPQPHPRTIDEITANSPGAIVQKMSAYMIVCLPPLMFLALLLAILYTLDLK